MENDTLFFQFCETLYQFFSNFIVAYLFILLFFYISLGWDVQGVLRGTRVSCIQRNNASPAELIFIEITGVIYSGFFSLLSLCFSL